MPGIVFQLAIVVGIVVAIDRIAVLISKHDGFPTLAQRLSAENISLVFIHLRFRIVRKTHCSVEEENISDGIVYETRAYYTHV